MKNERNFFALKNGMLKVEEARELRLKCGIPLPFTPKRRDVVHSVFELVEEAEAEEPEAFYRLIRDGVSLENFDFSLILIFLAIIHLKMAGLPLKDGVQKIAEELES